MAKEDIVKYQFDKRTPEEQHEIAVAGGIASGKARQEKATFKKTLEMLLDEKNAKGKTYRELIILGQIASAIDGKAENFKAILALMGEMEEEKSETPNVTINIVDNSGLESVLYDEDKQ